MLQEKLSQLKKLVEKLSTEVESLSKERDLFKASLCKNNIIAGLSIGDYVHIAYQHGEGDVRGIITHIWEDLQQAQINKGWCFHPNDMLLKWISKEDVNEAQRATARG